MEQQRERDPGLSYPDDYRCTEMISPRDSWLFLV
jgi:hypothetical protein